MRCNIIGKAQAERPAPGGGPSEILSGVLIRRLR